jgi:hypothetical protein
MQTQGHIMVKFVLQESANYFDKGLIMNILDFSGLFGSASPLPTVAKSSH